MTASMFLERPQLPLHAGTEATSRLSASHRQDMSWAGRSGRQPQTEQDGPRKGRIQSDWGWLEILHSTSAWLAVADGRPDWEEAC